MIKKKILNIAPYIFLVISLSILLLIIPSFTILGKTINKIEKLYEIYGKWYVLKSETIIYIYSQRKKSDVDRFLFHLKAFDRTVEYLFDERIITLNPKIYFYIDEKLITLRPKGYFYIDENQEFFIRNWQEVQLALVCLVSGFIDVKSLANTLLWVTSNSVEFDMMIESLFESTNKLNIKIFKRYLIAIYILFISIVIIFFMLFFKNIEYIHAKKTEDKIRFLAQSIESVRDNERKRIALDLHDSLIHGLAVIKNKIVDQSYKRNSIADDIDSVIVTAREISFNLRPMELDKNFIDSIKFYINDISRRSRMDIVFFSFGFKKLDIPENLKINLFRIIQEILNNVEKHSKAKNATVKLSYSFPFIVLAVADNGVGIDDFSLIKNKTEEHMGMRGLMDRVDFLNGTFKIITGVNKGVKIFIRIPYNAEEVS